MTLATLAHDRFRPAAKNPFLERVTTLAGRLDAFRREQGFLVDPDGYAVCDLISLETEALVRLSLGQSFDETGIEPRLKDAYRAAVSHRMIDTEQVAAAYARMLPVLKAPFDSPIWAEDTCLYNLHLESNLANRDYATMTYLLVRQQMEELAGQAQGRQGQTF